METGPQGDGSLRTRGSRSFLPRTPVSVVVTLSRPQVQRRRRTCGPEGRPCVVAHMVFLSTVVPEKGSRQGHRRSGHGTFPRVETSTDPPPRDLKSEEQTLYPGRQYYPFPLRESLPDSIPPGVSPETFLSKKKQKICFIHLRNFRSTDPRPFSTVEDEEGYLCTDGVHPETVVPTRVSSGGQKTSGTFGSLWSRCPLSFVTSSRPLPRHGWWGKGRVPRGVVGLPCTSVVCRSDPVVGSSDTHGPGRRQ